MNVNLLVWREFLWGDDFLSDSEHLHAWLRWEAHLDSAFQHKTWRCASSLRASHQFYNNLPLNELYWLLKDSDAGSPQLCLTSPWRQTLVPAAWVKLNAAATVRWSTRHSVSCIYSLLPPSDLCGEGVDHCSTTSMFLKDEHRCILVHGVYSCFLWMCSKTQMCFCLFAVVKTYWNHMTFVTWFGLHLKKICILLWFVLTCVISYLQF